MSVTQLCAGAEAFIKIMHLTSKEVEVVRATVHNYACPNSFCAKIYWVAYRALQAIKGLFTASSWETTRKLIRESWTDRYIVNGDLGQLKQTANGKIFIIEMKHFFSEYSEAFLTHAILIEEKQPPVTPEFRAALDKLVISRRVVELIKKLKGLTA